MKMIEMSRQEDNMNILIEHPGRLLERRLEVMGMGVKEFAVRVSKPEKTVIAVLKGESAVTPDMAVAFEPVLRLDAEVLMEGQRLYDEYQARLRREEQMALSEGWMMKFPVDEMIARGWIPDCKSPMEKIYALFDFFGISTEKAWEDYYLNQELKVAFGFSLAQVKDPYLTSAWLRYGELRTAELGTKEVSETQTSFEAKPASETRYPFSAKLLREYLPLIKSVMANEREGWYEELEELCGNVGVKLVVVPNLPGMLLKAAIRWVKDSPMIQLSGISGRYDEFWTTIYHALGHILLHGKKDVFMEGVDNISIDPLKEQEADKFAADNLLSRTEERKIIARGEFSPEAISQLAESFGTHPSIIKARLESRGLLPCAK